MVADDLDGVLVRAHGAVRAEAVEHAAHGAFGAGVELFAQRQRGAGHIVHNAHGEVVLGRFEGQVVVHGLDHRGVELLGAQAIAAADHGDIVHAGLAQRGAHVGVQRLAEGTGFLRAVEHGDLLAAGGDRGQEVLHGERTVQMHLNQAQLLALGVEVIDGFFDGFAARTHGDHHAVRVRRADVVKQLVLAAGDAGDVFHHGFDDGGRGLVILVGGFAALEVNVRVLRGALLMRMLRIERALAEAAHRVPIHQLLHLVVLDLVDLLQLMARAETVEEMQEGNAGLQRGHVRHQRHVHGLLHGVGSEHGEARLPAGHHVGMVAKDGQRVVSQRARAHMEHARQQLAGNLVHVRDHQQKALGRGERRGERARGQRAVHSARGARFRLHLRDANFLPKKVRLPSGSPLVGRFGHRRRRRYRINGCHIAERICDMAGGGIAVNGFLDAQLSEPPLFVEQTKVCGILTSLLL